MKFLLDESADARLIPFLAERGHDATRIGRDFPHGLPDIDVFDIAYREARILLSRDRDPGELIFVRGRSHAGVILFRLGSSPAIALTTARLTDVLSRHANDLQQFIVVTPHLIRVRPRD